MLGCCELKTSSNVEKITIIGDKLVENTQSNPLAIKLPQPQPSAEIECKSKVSDIGNQGQLLRPR